MKHSLVLLLGVLVVACLAYLPGLSGGFAFDDWTNIVLNPDFKDPRWSARWLIDAALSSDSGPLARPLSMLTFAVQAAATGMSPYPLKVANLAVHLLNGVLVFLLASHILRLSQSRNATPAPGLAADLFPALVAAAWLLAPINLTGVLYIVQRMESLSSFFMLLGLLAYLRGREQRFSGRAAGWSWMAAGIVAGTSLAALAKEVGVLLPAYAFVLEWVLFGLRHRDDGRLDVPMVAFFGLFLLLPGVAAIALTLPAAISGASYAFRSFNLEERLLTEGRIVTDYLKWMVVPNLREMGIHHDDYPVSQGWLSPPSTLASAALLVVLLAAALRIKSRMPLVSIGVLFFLVGHSLVSTYLPLELMYEHRNYLPSMGIFLALLSLLLLEIRPGWRLGGAVLTVGLIGVAGFTTFVRASEWGGAARLAYMEVARHPNSPRANYDMARILKARAREPADQAFTQAVHHFEAASRLPGGGLLALQGIVLTKAENGVSVGEDTWRAMEQVIRSGPPSSQDVGALYALIAACSGPMPCRFDVLELGRIVSLATSVNPGHSELLTVHANYAVNVARDYRQGMNLMLRAVALAPQKPEYWENLIGLQISAGMLGEARAGLGYLREIDRFGRLGGMIGKLAVRLAAREAEASQAPPQKAGQS